MHIARRRRPRRRTNLTALVDVIFLLVIFFVSSSAFLATGKLRLTEATETGGGAATSTERPSPPTPPLLVQPLGGGRVRVNAVEHAMADLTAVLDSFAGQGATAALIAPAAAATVQDLTTTLEAARQSRLEHVVLRPGSAQ